MSSKKNNRRATLADALDLTHWDYRPGKDRKLLLRPVGSVFGELPWEVRPQYLGPALTPEVAETDSESDDDVDTQPIEPLKK